MKLPITLAEAPTDVLIILADIGAPITRERIVELLRERKPDVHAAPGTDRDAEHALRLLRELGFVTFTGGADLGPLCWVITPEGRRVIREAAACQR